MLTRITSIFTLFFTFTLGFALLTPSKLIANDGNTTSTFAIEAFEFEQPEPIERPSPKYPTNNARSGIEGWVIVNFGVNETGKVQDVVVIDSSGNRKFENAARQAAKRWTYKPALKNGEPTYSSKNLVKFEFFMGDKENVVTRRFKNYYDKALTAIRAKDITEAKKFIDKINQRDVLNFTEIKIADQVSMAFHELTNDKLKQEYFANQSVISLRRDNKKTSLSNNDVLILAKAVQHATNNGNYIMVEDIYEQYFSGDLELPDNDVSARLIAFVNSVYSKLTDTLTNTAILERRVLITRMGTAHHTLQRDKFSIGDVQGKIEKIEIRCDTKITILKSLENDQLVDIPDSWGKCGVTVYGDYDSRFSIYEFNEAPTDVNE